MSEATATPADLADLALRLERVKRVFGALEVTSAIPHRKAIVFMDVHAAKAHLGDAIDEVAAQAAVDALRRIDDLIRRGTLPTLADLPKKPQLDALEACIRLMRPALLVEAGAVKPDPQLGWTPSQKAAVEAALPAVGSIGFLTSGDPFEKAPRVGVATCFAIGPRAVVTNVHVLADIAKHGRRLDEAVVRFDVELDSGERHEPVPVKGELGRCSPLDVVVLETSKDCPFGVLSIREATRVTPLQNVVAIGHPDKDTRTPAWAQVMFGDNLGVKRVSPGVVLGTEGEIVYHDASTLGGNSGSPLLDLDTGQVLAVHSLGSFADRNEAVGSGAIARDPGLRGRATRWV